MSDRPKMSSQKNIHDELRELNSHLPVPAGLPVFSVPDNYFNGLATSIVAKIKSNESSASQELQELSPVLAGISKQMPYSVPLFYFEQTLEGLPGITGHRASPLLDTIGKEMLYTVPQGYFDSLPQEIIAGISRPGAKIIPLFARKWVRMAAAAVVGGALFLIGHQFFDNTSEKTVAGGPTDNTQTLIARTTPAIEKEIKKVSTQELEAFMQEVPVASKEAKIKITSADQANVKELLKDVSDKDMETFLSALPTADEEMLGTDQP